MPVCGKITIVSPFPRRIDSSQVKFDSIVECGAKNKYLFLYYLRLQGMGENGLYICDYINLDENGLMVRMENCYDTTKCTPEFISAGAEASAQAEAIFKELNEA